MSLPHVFTIWWTSTYQRLRSVGEFEAPLQISTGFASWQRYCRAIKTLRRWTEGATYIRQGGHHGGHWSTFLVLQLYAHCKRPSGLYVANKCIYVYAKKWGLLCPIPWRWAGSPSNTMSPGPRPSSLPSGILIRTTVWPQYTNVRYKTDRETDGHTDT